ncbi:MAG: pyruvate carboxylase subunit B [Chthoniobacterales bacterium]|nr:pyruvate carboxylase subunit B [Chthoniobacterales bacterium]
MNIKDQPIQFNCTVLRDGHQSLAATRMTTEQMLPVAPLLDEAGFSGLETWGGATIDSCLRFLGENPFDRLRKLKEVAPKTPHLMLLRGQNIVQYTSFPDDVVEAFVRCTAEAGCDIFRIFDALNDPENLRTAIAAVRACGKHARGEICYTTSPVHTLERFVEFGCKLAEMGCHSLAIKDMSGIITPYMAASLVRELTKQTGLPVTLHSHDTAGLAAASYIAATDAGALAVETSIAPFANGTAQPDTVRMLALLEGNPRRPTHFNLDLLQQIREKLEKVYAELSEFTSPANERNDPDILAFQIPGGMLSNFRTQLRELKMEDRTEEVMREVPVVREALGWIPLVTPTSQIVGTQAMLNVKFGRWKNFAPAAMDIALGKYGKTPGPIDPEVKKLAIKNSKQEPIDCRPADLLEPRMEKIRAELAAAGLPTTDEACVLYAMFPQQTVAWYKGERPAPSPPKDKPKPKLEGARKIKVSVGDRSLTAIVEEVP